LKVQAILAEVTPGNTIPEKEAANIFTALQSFDGGIEESGRVINAEVTTTMTFTNVPGGSDGTAINWAHGLGTDNIDFGFTVSEAGTLGATGLTSVGASALSSNDRFLSHATGFATVPSDPSTTANSPATGNIRINVFNNSGVTTNSIKVHLWARKR